MFLPYTINNNTAIIREKDNEVEFGRLRNMVYDENPLSTIFKDGIISQYIEVHFDNFNGFYSINSERSDPFIKVEYVNYSSRRVESLHGILCLDYVKKLDISNTEVSNLAQLLFSPELNNIEELNISECALSWHVDITKILDKVKILKFSKGHEFHIRSNGVLIC